MFRHLLTLGCLPCLVRTFSVSFEGLDWRCSRSKTRVQASSAGWSAVDHGRDPYRDARCVDGNPVLAVAKKRAGGTTEQRSIRDCLAKQLKPHGTHSRAANVDCGGGGALPYISSYYKYSLVSGSQITVLLNTAVYTERLACSQSAKNGCPVCRRGALAHR